MRLEAVTTLKLFIFQLQHVLICFIPLIPHNFSAVTFDLLLKEWHGIKKKNLF